VSVITFDAAAHRYALSDGRELPSVTTILKAQGLIDDTWFTDTARLRGDFVHLACRMLDDDELNEATVDEAIRPYLDAYRAFVRTAKPEWTYIEHRVFDAVLGYAGTLDRAGVVGGHRLLVDLKSGGIYPSVGPQTAAYRRCLPEPHTWKRAALQLKEDGSYVLHQLTDRSDEDTFLAALRLHQWKQRHLS
jgi:hypothetical protein